MTELIGRLGPAGPIVVTRARLLPASLKLLWINDYYLDQGPDGSFMSAPMMADRIGLSASTVEKGRRLLRHLELLEWKPGRGRGDHWFPVLPREAAPREPREARLDVLQRLQLALDAHIRVRSDALPVSFFSFREWISQTHRAEWGRPTAPGGAGPPSPVGQTHPLLPDRPTAPGGASAPVTGGASRNGGGRGGRSTLPPSGRRVSSPSETGTGEETVLTNGTPGEKRAREKRGGAFTSIATLLPHATPPARLAGAD